MFRDSPRRGLFLSPYTGAIGTIFVSSVSGIATFYGINYRLTINSVSIIPAGATLTAILESSPNGSTGWVVNNTKIITPTTTVTDIVVNNPTSTTWYRAYLSVTADFKGPYTTPVPMSGPIPVVLYAGSGITGSFVVPARCATMSVPYLIASGGNGATMVAVNSATTGGGGGGGSAIRGGNVAVTPGQTFFFTTGTPGGQAYLRRDGNGNTANQLLAFGGQSASGVNKGNGGAAPQATGIFVGGNVTSVGGVASDGQIMTTNPGDIGYGGTGGHSGAEAIQTLSDGAPTHGDPGIGDAPAPPTTIYGHGGGGGGVWYLNSVGAAAPGKPGYLQVALYTA